ncbi:MAG: hypothetical protein ACI4M3_03220 [Acutalibacteraceae bacterium]
MKKIILAVMAAAMIFSCTACVGNSAQIEVVYTSEAPDAKTIKADDYEDNLEGLTKYLIALGYAPKNTAATKMLAETIGAKDGVRYVFVVNSSSVDLELYEYDTKNLNDKAKEVLEDVKKNGKFTLFTDSETGETQTFEATLSDSGKYLMIYMDSSSNEDNAARKKDIIKTVKSFKK